MTQIKLRSETIKVFKLIKNLEKQKVKSNQINKREQFLLKEKNFREMFEKLE